MSLNPSAFLLLLPTLTYVSSAASRRNYYVLLTLLTANLLRPQMQADGTICFVLRTNVSPNSVDTYRSGITVCCQWNMPFWGFAASAHETALWLVLPLPMMYTTSITRPIGIQTIAVSSSLFAPDSSTTAPGLRDVLAHEGLCLTQVRHMLKFVEVQARGMPQLEALLNVQGHRSGRPTPWSLWGSEQRATFVEVDITLHAPLHSAPMPCRALSTAPVMGTSFLPISGPSRLFTPLLTALFHHVDAPFKDIAQGHIPLFFQEQVNEAQRGFMRHARFKFFCFYVRDHTFPATSQRRRTSIPTISSATFKSHHMEFPFVGDHAVSSVTVSSVLQV